MTFILKEYPRCLHRVGGATCLVENDTDRDTKLAEGWSLLPVADAPTTPASAAASVSAEPAPEYHEVAGPPSGYIDLPKRGRKKAEPVN